MNKKRLIAYILAVSTLAGCSKNDTKSYKNYNNLEYKIYSTPLLEETNKETTECNINETTEDISISDDDGSSEDICDDVKKVYGSFYIVNKTAAIFSDDIASIREIEKYEKVFVLDGDSGFDGFSIALLSDGSKIYINNDDINRCNDELIDLDNLEFFNGFNDVNIKYYRDSVNYQQPNVFKFAKEDTLIYGEVGEILGTLDKYDIVMMVNISNAYDGYVFVELTDGTRGYVDNSILERLPDSFTEVDISEQTVYNFNNNELTLVAECVTGIPTYGTTKGTNLGYTSCLGTLYGAKLMGGAPSDIFISINGDGEGFHDARWRNKFGGNIYQYNGSHGCVNMKLEDVKVLDKYVKYGSKILVHK